MTEIIVGTGHRPNKLGGYGEDTSKRLDALALALIEKYQPETVVTGMALGWDMALARASVLSNTGFVACVPFRGQEGRWPRSRQEQYRGLLGKAREILYTIKLDTTKGPVEYGLIADAMQKRNRQMLSLLKGREGFVAALYNGDAKGGTANCVRDAKAQGLRVINLWQEWERLGQ
jgi:uncharacterized phage-like protein YoqJ